PQDRPRSRDGRPGRHQADELRPGHLGAAGLGLGGDPLDDLVERCGLVVLDVHAHLDDPRARKLEPERPHARIAAVALAYQRRDLAGDLERGAAKVDVERDQRPPRADDRPARARMEPARAEVGGELAGVEPALELPRPPATEERRPATWRDRKSTRLNSSHL